MLLTSDILRCVIVITYGERNDMTIKHQKIIAVLLVALLGAEMMHVGLKNRPAEE